MGGSSSKDVEPRQEERKKVVCNVAGGGVLEIKVPITRAEIEIEDVTLAEFTGEGMLKFMKKTYLSELERKVKAFPKKDARMYARRWLGLDDEAIPIKKVNTYVESSDSGLTIVYKIEISEEVAQKSCLVSDACKIIKNVEFDLDTAGDVALAYANPIQGNVLFFSGFTPEFYWNTHE